MGGMTKLYDASSQVNRRAAMWMDQRKDIGQRARVAKIAHIIVVLVLASVVLLSFRDWPHDYARQGRGSLRAGRFFGAEQWKVQEAQCVVGTNHLQALNLSKSVYYYQRSISLSDRNAKTIDRTRIELENVVAHSEPLLSRPPQLINSDEIGLRLNDCDTSFLDLQHVKQSHNKIDARHVLFGVATTAERLAKATPRMATWLGKTGARLVVALDETTGIRELKDTLAAHEITHSLYVEDLPFLLRYFKLVQLLHRSMDAQTKWAVIIDDDTHYFGLPRFLRLLETYDASIGQYVGGMSENLHAMAGFGLMAYGGAGIAISRPLLAHLDALHDVCVQDDPNPKLPGDRRVKECIYNHSRVRFSNERDLHQSDVLQLLGSLESSQPPISVHHIAHLGVAVDQITLAGQACGYACLFKRWSFPTKVSPRFDMANLNFGVFIVGYAPEVRPDFTKIEIRWPSPLPAAVFHAFSPLRGALQEDRERYTFLLEKVVHETSLTRHFYVKRRHGGADSVIELLIVQ